MGLSSALWVLRVGALETLPVCWSVGGAVGLRQWSALAGGRGPEWGGAARGSLLTLQLDLNSAYHCKPSEVVLALCPQLASLSVGGPPSHQWGGEGGRLPGGSSS